MDAPTQLYIGKLQRRVAKLEDELFDDWAMSKIKVLEMNVKLLEIRLTKIEGEGAE